MLVLWAQSRNVRIINPRIIIIFITMINCSKFGVNGLKLEFQCILLQDTMIVCGYVFDGDEYWLCCESSAKYTTVKANAICAEKSDFASHTA
jgi:hypothetical protein